MTEKRKHHIHLALMFGAYMFLHTTTLLLANRESNGYISAALEENMYYIHMIFMIMGFLSFALVKRLTDKKIKIITAASLSVLTVGIALLYVVKAAWVFVGIGSMAVFCLGYLGGLVYWRMSMETASGSRTGACYGNRLRYNLYTAISSRRTQSVTRFAGCYRSCTCRAWLCPAMAPGNSRNRR